ncbi:hypothetical protein HYU09_05350 [Candidatus Woesearchaeota archaeon]|nr:hypothetical protein [Candidatus Woesearchaeota archaeon]
MPDTIGLNVSVTNKTLDELLSWAVRTIQRSVSVKKIALEKFSRDDEDDRIYGITHIYNTNNLQLRSYQSHLRRLAFGIGAVGDAIKSLEKTRSGVIDKSNAGQLESGMALLKENLEQVYSNVNHALEILRKESSIIKVEATMQNGRRYYKSVMYGFAEAELRTLLRRESEINEAVIKSLKFSMGTFFRIMESVKKLQASFLGFLEKVRKGKVNFNFEVACNNIEDAISSFYAIKTVVVVLGWAVYAMAPGTTMGNIGAIAASGFMGVDFIVDCISSLPAGRRWFVDKKERFSRIVEKWDQYLSNLSNRFTLEGNF